MNIRNKQIYAYVATHVLMLLGWGNLLLIGVDNTANNDAVSALALITGSFLAAIQIMALLHDFNATASRDKDPETRW